MIIIRRSSLMKKQLPGSTALLPVPAVMVSCGSDGHKPNIITIAWAGTVNSAPPMVSVSIRASRHSYALVKASQEFVVNIPTVDQVNALDYCGVESGSEVDKFAGLNLTPVMGTLQQAPMIKECPVNLECQVVQEIDLGSHTMFIGEVKHVHINERVLNEQGRIDHKRLQPIAYCSPNYYSIGEPVGQHGMTNKVR